MEIEEKRYQLSKKQLQVIYSGHPWLYGGSISSAASALSAPSLLRMVDGQNNFAAYGIYEPRGAIGIRILSRKEDFNLAQLSERLKNLLEAKEKYHSTSAGYRLMNGEGDGFPGLTCDIYSGNAIWQPYLSFWDVLLPAFADILEAAGFSSQLIKPPKGKEQQEPEQLMGQTPHDIEFAEAGVKLIAYPYDGQKSGFFLDLREVRKLLPSLIGGGSLLNCFASSGAFSVAALLAGAGSATSVEQDANAKNQMRQLYELNGLPFSEESFIQADVWEWLVAARGQDARYDLIILDPPNMCSSRASLKPALKGWRKLIEATLPLLAEGGKLLAINCSSRMTEKLCQEAVKDLPLKIEKTGGLPPDHTAPKSWQEGRYLHFSVMRVVG